MSEIEEWVREEQANLWYDLQNNIRAAVNGAWSMGAANSALRIIEAARLVGPTPWGDVPTSLVAGHVYETVLRAGGFDPEVPDEAEWQRIDELQQRTTGGYYQRREESIREYASTVAAINTDREIAYLRTGAE